ELRPKLSTEIRLFESQILYPLVGLQYASMKNTTSPVTVMMTRKSVVQMTEPKCNSHKQKRLQNMLVLVIFRKQPFNRRSSLESRGLPWSVAKSTSQKFGNGAVATACSGFTQASSEIRLDPNGDRKPAIHLAKFCHNFEQFVSLSKKIVKGRLRQYLLFWKGTIGANKNILSVIIINGYVITFVTKPQILVMKSNSSALTKKSFVESAVSKNSAPSEVPFILHDVNSLSVASNNSSGKQRLILDLCVLNTFVKNGEIQG
ncbi:hypothetical protein MAR_004022, partial [Mya arenaria]